MRTLVIVEKPSVAREFAKVLGANTKGNGFFENEKYVIAWCVGHLVTMSMPAAYDAKYKKWNINDLPFIPDEFLYEIISNVSDQYKVLKKFMNSPEIDTILYAGDSGREGEYIGRLVRMMSGIRKGIFEKRVWIDSQTEEEILRGIREAKPLSEYDSLSDAAYLRAIEDYLSGINFSRALSCKYGTAFNKMIKSSDWCPISVGRVMTCVLGMITAREREIRNFVPTDYFRIIGNVNGIETEWKVQEKSQVHNSPLLYNEKGFLKEADALSFIGGLNRQVTITQAKSSQEKKKPSLFYNLAELQNDCSKIFKISPDTTLKTVQSLYEKKLTTYPRTDARVISTAVAKEIDKNIKGLTRMGGVIGGFASDVLSTATWRTIAKTQYTDDTKITDHYAIIPTGDISNLHTLTELETSVFELIAKRFLAVFFPDAVFTRTTLECTETHKGFEEKFSTSVRILTTPGFMEVTGIPKDATGKQALSAAILKLKTGDILNVEYNTAKSETQPPKRYNSGSMILAMENAGNLIEEEELRNQIKGAGIGTSATRADILSKLIKLGYIRLDNKTQVLYPLDAGEIVYDIVKASIPDLLSPKMTANWELGLEQVRNKTLTRQQYQTKIISYVEGNITKIKQAGDFTTECVPSGSKDNATSSGVGNKRGLGVCPLCGGNLFENSKAFSCSNWNGNPKCDFTIWKNWMMEVTFTKTDVAKLAAGKTITKDVTNKAGKTWKQKLWYSKAEKKVDFAK